MKAILPLPLPYPFQRRLSLQSVLKKRFLLLCVAFFGLALLAAVKTSAGAPAVAPAFEFVVQPPCTEETFDGALANVTGAGGGTIRFNCGTAGIVVSNMETIQVDLVIDGSGNQITLSGGNKTRLFRVPPGVSLTLRELTVSNGYSAGGDGGAIFSEGTLVVEESTFRDNHTVSDYSGGAIRSSGLLTITDSLFADNSGGNAGALYPRWGNAVTVIENSRFEHNRTTNSGSGWGGAILTWDGASVTVRNSEFFSNTARAGGAIYNTVNSSVLVQGGSLNENVATGAITPGDTLYGGGAIFSRDELTLENVTMDGNRATYVGGAVRLLGPATLNGEGLRVRRNRAYDGGGMYNSGGQLNLTGATLSGNEAVEGGGALSLAGRMTTAVVQNAVFQGNQAALGGAILLQDQAVLALSDSAVRNNRAQHGGGIYNWLAPANLFRVTVQDNDAVLYGGGMRAEGALTASASTFAGNGAYSGAAIYNQEQQVPITLARMTVSGNRADDGSGAAIFGTWATFQLVDVTIAANTGAFHLRAGASAELKNSVLAESSVANCSLEKNGFITSQGYNLADDQSCASSLTAVGDQNNAPAGLGALADHGGPTLTHLPAPDSRLVDRGQCGVSADQRGQPRPVGLACDIGAVERQPEDGRFAVYLPFVRR